MKNNTPLLILGSERRECHEPSMRPYILLMFATALVCLCLSFFFEGPQELNGSDRTMRDTQQGPVPGKADDVE